jgi:hypothetical protein
LYHSGAGDYAAAVQLQRSGDSTSFSNFLNKALMGKRIMHSARALFLTFLALEKSKRNTILYKDYATAELMEGRDKICSAAEDLTHIV